MPAQIDKEIPIPVEQFGRDHWSTFAYVACVVTGSGGIPDKNRMRTDAKRHPGLIGLTVARFGDAGVGGKYPTRLAGGVEQQNHDDWDCADDLERLGLIKWEGTGINPIFALTDKGWAVFKALTAFKEKGGSFATFRMPKV